MALETFAFDSSEFLDDEESVEEYLTEALGTSDADTFVYALGVVARARGMTEIARDLGWQRKYLYYLLSTRGRSELETALQRKKQFA